MYLQSEKGPNCAISRKREGLGLNDCSHHWFLGSEGSLRKSQMGRLALSTVPTRASEQNDMIWLLLEAG
jgi:hypothetical protein